MVSKVFIIAAVIAYVEARFGQEQLPIAAISSVQGGAAGAAPTIAGAAISDLLGAANSCAKLTRADQIFTELGGGADALAAAIGMVTAEKNTNPFANGNVQNVCGDASLPATPELRGITPLIDPAVDVDGAAAALSKSSAASPLAADGMSVFDLMKQAGLGDLVTSQGGAGGAAAGGAAAGGAAQGGKQNAGNANNNQQGAAKGGNQAADNKQNQNNNQNDAAAGQNNAAVDDGAAVDCNAGNAGQNNNNAAAGDNQAANNGTAAAGNDNANQNQNANQNAGNNNANQNQNQNQNAGNNNQGAAADNGAAADFGKCKPTIFFAGGQNGRPATEFTFQIEDPLARGGQGEALNPDIITNALCNQLTNVCEANDAAVAKCESAKAAVKGGARDQSTADTFNSLVLGGAGARARKMRRGLRA